MTLALLFPGQGTQHPSMLAWLDHRPEAAATLKLMEVHLGSDWRARLGDEAWASHNRKIGRASCRERVLVQV